MDRKKVLEVLKQLRKFVDDNYTGKDIFLVGEAASDFSLYFGNGKDIFHSSAASAIPTILAIFFQR